MSESQGDNDVYLEEERDDRDPPEQPDAGIHDADVLRASGPDDAVASRVGE